MSLPFFDAASAAGERPAQLPDLDPELNGTAGARQADLSLATVRLQPGRWTASPEVCERALALLVLDGVLVRTVRLERQSCSELIGEGDLICPWEAEQQHTTIPADVDWDVLQSARLGLLDQQFFATASRSPEVSAAFTLRGIQRSHRLAFQLAIGELRRIDERLIALFVHLGDRWGRRTPAGVHVPLALTHELIAQLVGAQRPTVTTGLNELQRTDRLFRSVDRTWTVAADALKPVWRAA
jgi:hypothetical protein